MSTDSDADGRPSTTEIFVSHSAEDKEAVDAFRDLLMTGANVNSEEIFASSVPGTGVTTGENFVEEARENLLESKLVVLFITPNFYASRFCLAETGAAWIREDKDIFPLVAKDLDREIGANMLGVQTERFTERGLESLYDKIQKVLSGRDWPTPLWNAKQAYFLDRFEEIYSELPKPAKVNRDKFDSVVAGRDAAVAKLEAVRSKLEDEKARRQEVEELKDREQVRAVAKQYTDVHDQYENLFLKAQDRLGEHSSPVQRALYAEFEEGRGVWTPEQSTLRAFNGEIQRAFGSVKLEADNKKSPNEIWVRKPHPAIRETIGSLENLGRFLREEEDFTNSLKEKHEFPINIANRQYWREILLEGTELIQ